MRIAHWFYTVPLRLRSLFRRETVESELEEELRFHLDHAVAEGLAKGLSPAEARRKALLALGGPELRRDDIRDARRVSWLLDFAADLRFASRSLRRTPVASAVVVVTLAFGIGMTATPFSMLDALILRPYPVPQPGEIVTLVGTTRDEGYAMFSYREYLDLRDRTRSYTGVVAQTGMRPVSFAADATATPRVKSGVLVSGNYFATLGVEPSAGRGFLAEEDAVPGRNPVTVVAHDFWTTELGGDPAAVGRTIRLNGEDFTVVGVAPESFPGMTIFNRPDVYVPLAMARRFSGDAARDFFEHRDARQLRVMARLAPGVGPSEAGGEVAALAAAFRREYPRESRGREAAVKTAFEVRTRGDANEWKFSVVFTVLGIGVLLVASTNVAGLLLSRARSRTREVAVRLALGAGRSRLVRFLLAESLILAGLGGALGVVVAYGGITYLREFDIPAELPVTIPFQLDGRVLAASLLIAGATALLCGLAPALQSTRADLVVGLKAADVEPPGRKRLWGRSALVVAQVALSLMLLASTFLMARSFRESVGSGLGFPMERLLAVRFDPRLVQYDADRTRHFYDQLLQRVEGAPGVLAASLAANPPLSIEGFDALSFVPDGYDLPEGRESFVSASDVVDARFLGTIGVPLVRGRAFAESDAADAPRVAIVNETFAERYWPGDDAVGKRIRLGGADGEPLEIVGIAQTVSFGEPGERRRDFVYLPLAQHPRPRLVLLVRTAGDPLQLVEPLREIVRAIDPNLPMLATRTIEDLYRYHAVEGPAIAVEMCGTMGVVGLLLAVTGLYGLVAYNVSRRTKEIGIRMAIGATPATALRLVMANGLALVGIGTVLGLALGVGVEKVLIASIFDAGGIDFVTYLVVVPALVAATVVAAWLPARRATRVAPTLALRHD